MKEECLQNGKKRKISILIKIDRKRDFRDDHLEVQLFQKVEEKDI